MTTPNEQPTDYSIFSGTYEYESMPLLKPDDTSKTFNFETTAVTGKIGNANYRDISTRNGIAVKSVGPEFRLGLETSLRAGTDHRGTHVGADITPYASVTKRIGTNTEVSLNARVPHKGLNILKPEQNSAISIGVRINL